MIPIRWASEIKPDPNGDWQLTLFIGEAFDFSIPFRCYLDQIIVSLGGADMATLHLPPWEEGEDFIDGTLLWAGREIAVYFEYSLAYLDFSSPDVSVVEDLLARIRPRLHLE